MPDEQKFSPTVKSERIPAPQADFEHLPQREKSYEISGEKSREAAPEKSRASSQVFVDVGQAGDLSAGHSDITLQKVESILSEDMDQVFLGMDASTQQTFKLRGEETARKISTLLGNVKTKAHDIFLLILEWLQIIPRVNRHYAEQEAKIKADAIMKLYKK